MKDVNFAGEECPECGLRTHEARHDGEVWNRCVTDSCERGWYEVE